MRSVAPACRPPGTLPRGNSAIIDCQRSNVTQSAVAATAAVSVRRMFEPSDTRSRAASSSSGDHPPSGPIATDRSAGLESTATGLGDHEAREHRRCLDRRIDLDAPHTAALPTRLVGDTPKAYELRAATRSGFHRTTERSACSEHEVIDAEFGHLLHEPVEPVTLRHGHRQRERVGTRSAR